MLSHKKFLVVCTIVAFAGTSAHVLAAKTASVETGLVGVKLYSTGLTVVDKYGSPDSIEALNIGGNTSNGGPSGGPGGSGPGSGPRSAGNAGGGGGGGASAATQIQTGDSNPLDFGNSLLQQTPGRGPKRSGAAGGSGPGSAGAGGPGGPGNGSAGNGGAGGANGQGTTVVFTRWVYHRNGSEYSFVFDKYNHVVQIEAIGLHNSAVRTKRGVSFGSSLASVIKKYTHNHDGSYDAPGYELSGDALVLKFLVKNHVAFRFSRLAKDRPQVVTGIAVAGGKY